jgi:hypothetical protein
MTDAHISKSACPHDLAVAIVEIMRQCMLDIRRLAEMGDSQAVFRLSDRLHNAPRLLTDFSDAKLEYFYKNEAKDMLAIIDEERRKPYEQHMLVLSKHLGRR